MRLIMADGFEEYRLLIMDKLATHGKDISEVKDTVTNMRLEFKIDLQVIHSKLKTIIWFGSSAVSLTIVIVSKIIDKFLG